MNRLIFTLCVASITAVSLFAAETYEVAGVSFKAMRTVNVPTASMKCPVIVTAFLHEGRLIRETKGDPRTVNAGKTLIVVDKKKKVVPFRILQLGPGDFCRLAIQAEDKTNEYTIYYGIEGNINTAKAIDVPAWTSNVGLLMETREFVSCDMNDANSVRDAFMRATPIGADYVSGVAHSFNPMLLRQASFMTRYTGTLMVAQGGNYALITSSHHCSFLLIDDRVAASHPGQHGREWQAKPELVKRTALTQGPHKFEYLHASADSNFASMVACWEYNPGERMKPVAIPPEAFQVDGVARLQAGPVAHAGEPNVPDFEFKITGSVPLPDNEDQLICVQFTNRSGSSLVRGKGVWDFGDGQTSSDANPYHIFLRPGEYDVTLSAEVGEKTTSITNRLEIAPPPIQPEKPHTLDNYLTSMEKYDASKLAPEHLSQLIQAFEAKIESVSGGEGREDLPLDQMLKPTREAIIKYRKKIAESVRDALVKGKRFDGDHDIREIALAAGAIARDQLADLKMAGQIYTAAAGKIENADMSAECSALAADVALDMGNVEAAKKMMATAEKRMNKTAINASAATVFRVQGDLLSATGDGEGARKAYRTAQERNFLAKGYAEKIALQGSASRSAEGFLKAKHYERAVEMLRTWQREYPAAAVEGYITLLFAEYWLARENYDLSASLADRLMCVNPDAPYVDQILIVAAQAKEKAGNKDAALSYLQTLTKNYPGSPLVEEAKEISARLKN